MSSDCGDEQVIAPLLVTLRVANKTAATSNSTISRTVDPIRFRSQESTGGYNGPPDEGLVSSMDVSGEALNELNVGDEKSIQEVLLV